MRGKDGEVGGWTHKGQPTQDTRIPDSVIRVMRHKGAIAGGAHPAVFPVSLAEEMIAAWSDPGDLLYEPFTGSGSQLIAATNLDRTCFGMELDPAYCDVAVRRWQLMTGGTATHAETGASFEAETATRKALAA